MTSATSPVPHSASVEKTACILCSRNCGLEVEIDNNQFGRIRGDEQHPVTHGYICQKAARLQHYQAHADRLTHPLKRQPDGSFLPVSWDEALGDIAQRLVAIRDTHGGDAFAFVGGGGQGNHLGGAYSKQMLAAMRSRFSYNALGQEKTGDFWVNGRLFGSQKCHTTEDVEHADYLLVIGANPYQAHGIPNARDTLNAIKKDPKRTMVVIDPRRSETAKMADIHLQIKPGTDAYLMSAMLAIIVQEGLHNRAFLDEHCTGFEDVEKALRQIPIEDYVARADVPLELVQQVARGYAKAQRGCVRIDLGIQQTLHTTLNAYLEKLLYLVTGHFGRPGVNNLHTLFIPLLGHTDERGRRNDGKPGKPIKRTAHHKMHPIAGVLPPNILPDEILLAGDKGVRAVIVDSSNPMLTYADTARCEQAFKHLELLVVVDVAMTETARQAHYVLPAASQFEKWEASGFNAEFPRNGFQLRHKLFPALGESLPEPEIYTRLLEKMGLIPTRFPVLEGIARHEPDATMHLAYLTAFGVTLSRRKHWFPYAASIMYRTLGKALPNEAAAAAPLLALSILYTSQHTAAVKRAGHRGNRLTMGSHFFRAVLKKRSGIIMSEHEFADTWRFIKHPDGRVHLHIPEMLEALHALRDEVPPGAGFPFILMAGERRSYNANQIYRDPTWRKVDPHGAMRMHPQDAAALNLNDGDHATVDSGHGQINAVIELNDTVRRGVVTLPHGYGQQYRGGPAVGPELNRLTQSAHCEPLTRTPFHKYVPVRIVKMDDTKMTATRRAASA